ncbi:hypothetical protein MIND_00497900 [Mycena indigotica]|uniref:2-dehydropantoate 2-reductase n=1 Tax=Mycena indigotica TaxID=2126181 RepID=A0A8H6SW69_9AGAR|nr:uncharacterized protein MIND_00497900 [Mycena indigotica]KAF7307048.1 hypothetical protein MIND_00497900 [Mycena indigotica]
MKICVAGNNALGSLIAHHIRLATPSSHSVTLLHRNEIDAFEAPTGFSLRARNTTTTSSGIENDTFKPTRTAATPIESLILATRPYWSVRVLEQLAPRLAPHSTIVLVQNGHGLAIYDRAIRKLFADRNTRPHFIFANTTHTGYFEPGRPRILHHTNVGTLQFGIARDPSGRNFEASLSSASSDTPVHDRTLRLSDVAASANDDQFLRYRSLRNTIAAMLLSESLNTSWKPVQHIQWALRSNLVSNSIIQPLSSIIGCPTREIFQQASAVNIARRICVEATRVFKQEHQLMAKKSIVEDIDGRLIGVGRLPAMLDEGRLLGDCLKYAEESIYEADMLKSMRHHRPPEVSYLNGYLLLMGKTYGIQMPTTAAVADLVRLRYHIPLDNIST